MVYIWVMGPRPTYVYMEGMGLGRASSHGVGKGPKVVCYDLSIFDTMLALIHSSETPAQNLPLPSSKTFLR